MENEVKEKFENFLAEWNGTSVEQHTQLVSQTIQKKDPVLNFAIEICRLRLSIDRLEGLTGNEMTRATFLAVVTVSRVLILGSCLAYLFKGSSTAGELKARAFALINWIKLESALRAMDSEQFSAEYYDWTLRAVQKKQNPLPILALNSSIGVIKELAASSRPL